MAVNTLFGLAGKPASHPPMVSSPAGSARFDSAPAKGDVILFSASRPATAKSQPIAVRFGAGSDKSAAAIARMMAESGRVDLSKIAEAVIPATVTLELTRKPESIRADQLQILRNSLRELSREVPFEVRGLLLEQVTASDDKLIDRFLTEGAGGSGFWIAGKDGKRYLVTNHHVATALDDRSEKSLRPRLEDVLPVRGLGSSLGALERLFSSRSMVKLGPVQIKGELNFVRDAEAVRTKKEAQTLSFRVVRHSKAQDLAVLEPIDPATGKYKAPPAETPVLEFMDGKDADQAAKPGKAVLKVGRHGGNIAPGIVNSIKNIGPCKRAGSDCHCFLTDNLYVESSLDLSKGDSGGPLISVEAGKVLGVNTLTDGGHDAYTDGHGWSLFAPEAVKVLKAWNIL